MQLRAKLKELPPLDESRLWSVQARAIRNLEASFADAHPRALIQMATGSGKTFTAVNVVYRLLEFGGARRILFLVDRSNLGRQTESEFANFTPPDDPRNRDELRERYRAWLQERDTDGAFTPEQREWLDRMAEHIAASLAIEPEDFESGWFGQHGSLGRAHALFGDRLRPLMADLNERLAA